MFQAIHDGRPDQSLLAYQYLQMMPKIAEGDANKVWIVPSEIGKALEGLGLDDEQSVRHPRRGRGSAHAGRHGSDRASSPGRSRTRRAAATHEEVEAAIAAAEAPRNLRVARQRVAPWTHPPSPRPTAGPRDRAPGGAARSVTRLEMTAILLAGVAAGTINTVVGSGTLITFPTLLAIGVPPVTANVSNTVGLVPGSLSGAIGYRRELAGQRRRLLRLGTGVRARRVAGRRTPAACCPRRRSTRSCRC